MFNKKIKKFFIFPPKNEINIKIFYKLYNTVLEKRKNGK